MIRSGQRSGFTLIELLVVVTIFGVMIAVIGISISGTSTTTNVRSAARGFVQISRYARTMAVLHQKPMLFSFSEGGLLSVTPRDGAGQNYSLVSSRAFASTNTLADREEADRTELEARETFEGGQSESMSDIQLQRTYENVKFVFREYADTIDDGWYTRMPIALSATDARATNTVESPSSQQQILYRSNGTCRPYQVQVSSLDEDKPYTLNITIDRLGVASIEEDREDNR
jgi:type II secretion system protein H